MASKYSKDHTIYRDSSGDEVPSVTTVLSVLSKSSLVPWANWMGLKGIRYRDYMMERARMGTDFHDMVSKFTMGKEIDGTHYQDAIDSFKLFRIWAERCQYQVIASEEALSCDEFGGTIDAISVHNGEYAVCDYKTSKGIYSSMFLQLAGYSILIKKNLPDTYDMIKKFGIVSVTTEKVSERFLPKERIEELYVPMFKDLLKVFNMWYKINKEDWNSNIATDRG